MKSRIFLFVLALGLVLGSSSIAIHYKQQATDLDQQLKTAETQRESLESSLGDLKQKLSLAKAAAGKAAEPVLVPDTAEADALRSQVQDLQQQLQAAQQVTVAAVATDEVTVEEEKKEEQPRRWNRRGAWLEELKESDPVRYEQIMIEHQDRKDRMHQSFADKSDFFLDRDLSGMSEVEVETYNHMVTLINETWELAELIDSDALPREERRDLRRKMRDNMRELDPLLEQERSVEIYELGLSLGYDDRGADEFAGYIQSVIDVTSMGDVWRGMRGGPRPPRDESPGDRGSRSGQ